MLKQLGLIALGFAIVFPLAYGINPTISLLTNLLNPVLPHFQSFVTLIKQNTIVSSVIASGFVGLTVNYLKNRQSLKMQTEALQKQNAIQIANLNLQSATTNLQQEKADLQNQLNLQNEKLRIYEEYVKQVQDFPAQLDGVRQETRMEMDTRLQDYSSYFNEQLKKLEQKKVSVYVP